MTIDINLIKQLRDLTGAGVADVKEALEEAKGDIEKAKDVLRLKGQKSAAKRIERSASQGLVGSYVHSNGKIGVLVEVNCETDFVARTADFQELVHNIALQIAAAAPEFVKSKDVPAEIIAKEKNIYAEEMAEEKKPEAIKEKIISGKLDKFYSSVCLLNQPFIKEDKKTVQDLVNEVIAKTGENVQIKRFVRFNM
ncbi:translation elongation factor Ts [Patescibacteria group bacterium]|nr:MAG: translation elongation factor Ts [Patescibacteria group bacterium]